MSAQIYNKIPYQEHFIGHNHKCEELGHITTGLSYNTLKVLMSFHYQYKIRGRVKIQELGLQTVFHANWDYLNISNSPSTIDRTTRELKSNNIALRYDTNRYVVSIDWISAFKIPQRKRYIEAISEYIVKPKAEVPTGLSQPMTIS